MAIVQSNCKLRTRRSRVRNARRDALRSRSIHCVPICKAVEPWFCASILCKRGARSRLRRLRSFVRQFWALRRGEQCVRPLSPTPLNPAAASFRQQIQNRVGGRVPGSPSGRMFDTQLRLASVFPGCGAIDEIRTQAVGRTEARPFADQHQRELRAEQLADFVFERHAAEADDDDRREPPAVARSGVAAAGPRAAGLVDGPRGRRGRR